MSGTQRRRSRGGSATHRAALLDATIRGDRVEMWSRLGVTTRTTEAEAMRKLIRFVRRLATVAATRCGSEVTTPLVDIDDVGMKQAGFAFLERFAHELAILGYAPPTTRSVH